MYCTVQSRWVQTALNARTSPSAVRTTMPGLLPNLKIFALLGRSAAALSQFSTPQWIAGFASVGYANVPGDGLVQMRALGITPDYIAGFQRIGYRNIPVSQLVELKALNITPEFVQTAVGRGSTMPPVNELVEIKMFGRRR